VAHLDLLRCGRSTTFSSKVEASGLTQNSSGRLPAPLGQESSWFGGDYWNVESKLSKEKPATW
jgi:hypothetical protein